MSGLIKLARYSVMKAIRVSEFGGPDKCKFISDVAVPKIGSDQVLIKMRAAGVNPVETYIVSGTYATKPTLPFTPGGDGAGTVSEVGSKVKTVKPGDRVFCLRSVTGTYAEYAVANAVNVQPLSEKLTFQQGACLGTPYYTAARALLHKASIRPAQTIFVHGGSGAVGLACCQIARAHGLVVMATAGSEAGLKLLKENGAHFSFNHRQSGYMQDVQASANDGQGPDVIIEMLANVNLEEDLKIAAKSARIVIVGSRGSIEVTPRHTMGKELEICGMALGVTSPEAMRELDAMLLAGIEAGWLRPVICKSYPLNEASEAQREVIAHTGGAAGKLVLDI